jgi:hypothetical protein
MEHKLIPAHYLQVGDPLPLHNAVWMITAITPHWPAECRQQHLLITLEDGNQVLVPADLLVPAAVDHPELS